MLTILRQYSIRAIASAFALVPMLVLAAGCDNSQSARSICDLQFGSETTLTARADPPANFHDELLEEHFRVDRAFEINKDTFANADLVWYQRDSGESVACVVFAKSDRVNAYFELSKDRSVNTPINLRILGQN